MDAKIKKVIKTEEKAVKDTKELLKADKNIATHKTRMQVAKAFDFYRQSSISKNVFVHIDVDPVQICLRFGIYGLMFTFVINNFCVAKLLK